MLYLTCSIINLSRNLYSYIATKYLSHVAIPLNNPNARQGTGFGIKKIYTIFGTLVIMNHKSFK